MAEIKKYDFSLRELTEILVERQGVREGKWIVTLELGITAGVIGANPGQAKPGALVVVSGVALERASDQQASELSFVVDASVLGAQRSAISAAERKKKVRSKATK